jgi:alanine racemase
MTRPTRARIDLQALAHNATVLRSLARQRRLMAVVKADAYGHGIDACARTLAPLVDALAVAFVEEALPLRAAGIDLPILVLEGPLHKEEADLFADHSLWSVIHRPAQLQWFESCQRGPAAGLWLKVDTGMHRLGLEMEAIPELIRRATSLTPGNVTLMSHLATAGDLQHPVAQRQLARWQNLIDQFDLQTSLLNSAATLLTENDDSHWLRPGYLFYGGLPDDLGGDLGLRPVMSLESQVIAVRCIAKGESVGYGGRWQATRDSRIATVAIGYGDGYPRSAADGTPVVIAGRSLPLAGRVSMDMITVDVTEAPEVEVGSPVTLWGADPGVDAVAKAAGTIGYELTSQITRRVPRLWEDNADHEEGVG